jgi:hypothetical protein
MKKQTLAIIFALLGAACTKRPDTIVSLTDVRAERTDSGEGQLYINALGEAVQKAEQIVVTEHSDVSDVFDSNPQSLRAEKYRPIIYNTHELSSSERADFLNAVKKMEPNTQDAFTACAFEPHHTITFVRQRRAMSTLRVCFQCGQVEWDGSNKTPPWSLIPTLKNMIEKIGMKGKRDWYALAKTVT